jgi:hypothetical protein
MAFPDFGILDDCARADETPLRHGGRWTADGTLILQSNLIRAPSSGFYYASWACGDTTSEDCQMYCGVNVPSTGGNVQLWTRVQPAGNRLVLDFSCQTTGSQGDILLSSIMAGVVDHQIDHTGFVTGAVTAFGVESVGANHTIWYRTAAGWQQGNVAVPGGSQPRGPGGFAVVINANTSAYFTSIGGGPISTTPPAGGGAAAAERGEQRGVRRGHRVGLYT